MNLNLSFRPLFMTVAACALLACNDDSNDPSGAISIGVDPAVVTIAQGGSGTVTVTLSRTPGFSNPVTLSMSNLPTGVTATFTPQVLEGLVASSAVDLDVGATTALGNHILVINATADGGSTTLTFTLTVVAAGLR